MNKQIRKKKTFATENVIDLSIDKQNIVNLHHNTIDDCVIINLRKKNHTLDRQKSTKKEVDTLSSSSLSSDNTLKDCKIQLDEILQRQPKSRLKYDRGREKLVFLREQR